VVQDSGGVPSGNQSYSQSVSFSGNQAVYLMGSHYMSSTSDYWIMIGASVGPVLDSSQWLFVPWTVAPAGSALTIDTNYALQPSFTPVTGESLVPPVVFAGCAASMSPSPQASQTPLISTMPSASPTQSTPTPTPSPSPLSTTSETPFPTHSPLQSPSPSPSPSGLPTLVGVTNMTANFDDAIATFNMSGAVPLGNAMSVLRVACCVLRVACCLLRVSGLTTCGSALGLRAGSNSTAPKNAANVVSTFSGLQLGNVSVPAASLSGSPVCRVVSLVVSCVVCRRAAADRRRTTNVDLARTVLNGSSADATYVYSASIGDNNATRFDQSFTFYDRDTNATFAGVDFAIPANSVKWSINFTVGDTGSSGSSPPPSHATQWSTVRYRLAGLLTSSADGTTPALSASFDRPITSRADTPAPRLTTYYVPLFEKTKSTTVVVAAVVLFDVAVVDRAAADIRHRIVAVAVNTTTIEYEVVFEFPPFNESLFYDPSLGLGVLLGADRDGSGGVGGGSDNTGLIVGVAVAIPVAVVVVVAAIAAGLFVAWRRRSNMTDSGRAINFSVADQGDEDYEL
jgi:hypothetical protein